MEKKTKNKHEMNLVIWAYYMIFRRDNWRYGHRNCKWILCWMPGVSANIEQRLMWNSLKILCIRPISPFPSPQSYRLTFVGPWYTKFHDAFRWNFFLIIIMMIIIITKKITRKLESAATLKKGLNRIGKEREVLALMEEKLRLNNGHEKFGE